MSVPAGGVRSASYSERSVIDLTLCGFGARRHAGLTGAVASGGGMNTDDDLRLVAEPTPTGGAGRADPGSWHVRPVKYGFRLAHHSGGFTIQVIGVGDLAGTV
ncbi:hypothetical protein [Frankia sp. Cas4]|uniref:hypothetical protein n=1 Tax=Frankia sp. Cas4 TaxID=3073927 RepID=UPI002AD2B11F|nr:hypothetical protein [Frankia sp. Cas4]